MQGSQHRTERLTYIRWFASRVQVEEGVFTGAVFWMNRRASRSSAQSSSVRSGIGATEGAPFIQMVAAALQLAHATRYPRQGFCPALPTPGHHIAQASPGSAPTRSRRPGASCGVRTCCWSRPQTLRQARVGSTRGGTTPAPNQKTYRGQAAADRRLQPPPAGQLQSTQWLFAQLIAHLPVGQAGFEPVTDGLWIR